MLPSHRWENRLQSRGALCGYKMAVWHKSDFCSLEKFVKEDLSPFYISVFTCTYQSCPSACTYIYLWTEDMNFEFSLNGSQVLEELN